MRAALLAIPLLALLPSVAIGQEYPSQAPVPSTTSAPALRAMATQREIEERFKLGLTDLAQKRWPQAAGEFARIVALGPAEPRGSTARYDLAIAQANEGKNDEAAASLRAALALDPGFLAAMANLISVDLARGDLTEARAIADRFVAAAPESARALYARGIVALQARDATGAREDFQRLVHANPSYAVAHYDLALAEQRLGHLREAELELRAALALAPGYARAEFALGAVLLAQGRKPEARVAFAQASHDASGDPGLQNIAAAMRDSIAI